MSSKIALSISTATLVVLALGFGVTDSLESATGTEVPTRGNGKQHHDGIPNSLIYETSPYLLQHAHNPVKWYPWGPDALQLSRDKDILFSIRSVASLAIPDKRRVGKHLVG